MKFSKPFKALVFQRLLTFFLSFFSRYFVLDYDTSGIQSNIVKKEWDSVVYAAFGGFTQWDSIYFLKIAQAGYQHQQYHAFFPGLPVVVSTLGHILETLLGSVLSLRACLVLSGVLLQVAAFAVSLVYFHRLTRMYFDQFFAQTATLLYIFNPASIFFTAVYSESFFACCSFAGMYHLARGSKLRGALWMAAGAACRGNGLVSLGFLFFPYLYSIPPLKAVYSSLFVVGNKMQVRWRLIEVIAGSALVVAPFALFQLYGYARFCPGEAWCEGSFPLLYTHVQSTYWNQGFLRYYELKQLPNFALAGPMALLSLTGCWLTLARGIPSPDISAYAIHCLFLTLVGLTSMHVQVLTRFLCASCPIVYWWAAHHASADGIARKLVVTYFGSFWIIGTVLHSTFYPWT